MCEIGEVHEREAGVIEWTVRDFLPLPAREGLCFSSPKFPLDGLEWYLCMYPNGEHTEESKGYIVIYLLRISYDSPIQRNLSLGVKTSINEIVEDKRPIHNYKMATYQHKWPRFMKMSTLLERQSELVPSGHLTLVCRKKNPPSTDATGYSASAPQSQSYSGSPGDGAYGGSAPSIYGSQPPNSGVASSAAPGPAYGAGAPPSTGASEIPPVGPPSHDPPVHGTAPPPGGYGGPPPGADYNRPPGRYDGSPAPGGPGPMPGGPGGDYGSPTGYGGPGGRGGFQVNNSKTSESVVKSKILEDFKQLLQNQENCDVILRVKGQEFPSHRSILTARSSVFASAFRNDMKEKATGVVDIEDCDPFTFSDFLRFLYCEDVEGLSNETVFSLFFAADKYDVSNLRGKCLEFMKENLSVDTFCNTLTLALRHSETQLVRFATDFFVANADKIIVTVAWQTFAVENPIQSNELFIKFVASVKH